MRVSTSYWIIWELIVILSGIYNLYEINLKVQAQTLKFCKKFLKSSNFVYYGTILTVRDP